MATAVAVEGDAPPVMGRRAIMRVLPHVNEALLIDEVREYDPGNKTVVAWTLIKEPHCQGHFAPGNIVFPGYLYPEVIAQAAGLLTHLLKNREPLGDRVAMVHAVDGAKYHKPIIPGGVGVPVFITVTCLDLGRARLKFKGEVHDEAGELVAEVAMLTIALMPRS